jgi:methylmalonyl-CoA mutase, N-terminal domain
MSGESIVEFPFRRGITDVPYSEQPWIIGQYSGFSDPASTNRRFRDLIASGQQGLAIALDLPTQVGLDPDDPRSFGEVGRCGVSLASLADMADLFDGIALDSVRQISTTANSMGAMMIALFLALAEQRGVDPTSFSVRLQNDVLKEYVARGTQMLPVRPGVALTVDAIEYCIKNLPGWVPMSISGYHIRDAGASRERELGFTLSNAREYLRALADRGIDPADVARQVTWFLSSSSQPVEEAAKFRAARELWATELRDHFGVTDEDAMRLRIIVYTLGSELLPTEILNNSVRVTLAALGAVLGGVQTLFCSSIDEALGLPTDAHALLSLRTQQVLLNESGLAQHLDVLGGSAVVESLTDGFVEAARRIAAEVDAIGGSTEAIANGFMRRKIDDDSWDRFQLSQERAVVGAEKSGDVEVFDVDDDVVRARVERFVRLKEARDDAAVQAALESMRAAVERGDNLVEPMKHAFLAEATLGEVCAVLTDKHGRAGRNDEGSAA